MPNRLQVMAPSLETQARRSSALEGNGRLELFPLAWHLHLLIILINQSVLLFAGTAAAAASGKLVIAPTAGNEARAGGGEDYEDVLV